MHESEHNQFLLWTAAPVPQHSELVMRPPGRGDTAMNEEEPLVKGSTKPFPGLKGILIIKICVGVSYTYFLTQSFVLYLEIQYSGNKVISIFTS